jgi:Exocyst complex component Sec10
MEQLLTRAGNMSDLAFLRVLQLIHAQTSVLIEDLKSYDVPSSTPRSPVQNTGLSRLLTGPPAAAPGGAGSTAISSILETAMEELFVPYTEGQRYLERESKNLTELYSGYLSAFTRYHVNYSLATLPLSVLTFDGSGTGREINQDQRIDVGSHDERYGNVRRLDLQGRGCNHAIRRDHLCRPLPRQVTGRASQRGGWATCHQCCRNDAEVAR